MKKDIANMKAGINELNTKGIEKVIKKALIVRAF
jgi:hypothetical protein